MSTSSHIPAPLHLKYRPDIDGLRALAVLAVVGFHAFPEYIPGGFVGVDIFFVISGFLISTILFENLVTQRFSLLVFYRRRILRIFPALAVVLVCSYLFGWFILFPDEYSQLGKHIAGSAGFMQNWVLWGESGYFDNAADVKPLLHLWSLGIEEQFYIVWPLLLWSAYRIRLNLLILTVCLCLGSFWLNIRGVNVSRNLVATFYSPQTRFWELCAGAVLAYLSLYPHLRSQKYWLQARKLLLMPSLSYLRSAIQDLSPWFWDKSCVGMFLALMGIALINRHTPFPGWWALFPVLGAAALISAGPNATINRHVLSHRVMVGIGLISYPLYLWHWTILAFLRIIAGEAPIWWQRLLAIVSSFLLAYLTYRYIEIPIRYGYRKNKQNEQSARTPNFYESVKKEIRADQWRVNGAVLKTIVLIVLMASIGLVGYGTYKRDGLPLRKNIQSLNSTLYLLKWLPDDEADNNCLQQFPDVRYGYCKIALAKPATVALIGDSFANAYFNGLADKYAEQNENLVMMGGMGCPPLLEIESRFGQNQDWCGGLSSNALKRVANNPNIHTVILAANWHLYMIGDRFNHIHKDRPKWRIQKLGIKTDETNLQIIEHKLNEAIHFLQKKGKKVIVMKQTPELNISLIDCLSKRPMSLRSKKQLSCDVSSSAARNYLEEYEKDFDRIIMRHHDIVVWDPFRYFCSDDLCIFTSNGMPLYRDDLHLSKLGSQYLGKKIFDEMRNH